MTAMTAAEAHQSTIIQNLDAVRQDLLGLDISEDLRADLTSRFPADPAACLHAASTLAQRGHEQAAETLLRYGADRFPNDAGLRIRLAQAAHHRRDFPEAIRRWDHVIVQYPSHPAGYVGKASALRDTRRLDEAGALIDTALKTFPKDLGVLVEHARLADSQGAPHDAIARWHAVRSQFPDHPVGYVGGAASLRQARRFDEADEWLSQAMHRFPGDAIPLIEHARAAHDRRDWAAATERWRRVRQDLPGHSAGYTGGAMSLREAQRFDEADALLVDAMTRFPTEAAPVIDHAWVAHVRHDWPAAMHRWATVRARFPAQVVGYTCGAVASRNAGEFDAAEALLQDALARFPHDRAPLIEHAWLASAQRHWPDAARRWALVRQRFPDVLEGYIRGASALSEMWQYAEAEALLAEGIARFPNQSALLCDHAWLAFRARREDEAAARFAQVREAFPDAADGYIGGALCLRNQFRLPEAERMLEQAQALLPDDPRIMLEYAQLPVFAPFRRDRDYDRALSRLEALRSRFPAFEDGYTFAIRWLRDAEQIDQAEALGAAALTRLPSSSSVAVEHANTARHRAAWAEAIRRYEYVRDRFPGQPAGPIGSANALSSSGRHTDAEAALRDAQNRFPNEKAAFAEYATVAVRQADWKEALTRWSDAHRRFPDENEFAQRIFDARLRLTEGETAEEGTAVADATPAADPSDPRAEMRDIMMQFESIGGTGIGCEFGMFQREFGVEPLGLLRWADMPYEGIVYVLENRFDGVGLPENTELFLDRGHGRPEYCTRDTRGFMFQRCFSYEDDISFERMWKQSLRRLKFLKDKLIADLAAGNKIFVWRQTARNLTDGELDRLHAAMRGYGDNTLMYVRYQDAAHPNGTVERVRPGLLVGYIDRFKMSPAGELAAAPASASWTAICKTAHGIWKGSVGPKISRAMVPTNAMNGGSSTELTDRELVSRFESLGGTGHGCEFGLFQRDYGAEPLGLLRWADLGPEALTKALETRFEGVGLPEFTNVFIPERAEEYWTTDTRYHMAMRTFVQIEQIPMDRMKERICKRLSFLKNKLIDDLQSSRKIFVYKNMLRNLTDDEIASLHAALSTFGEPSLLYVRYEDPEHPNGTVRDVNGVMLGYIDHFTYSPQNEYIGKSNNSWLDICRKSFHAFSHHKMSNMEADHA